MGTHRHARDSQPAAKQSCQLEPTNTGLQEICGQSFPQRCRKLHLSRISETKRTDNEALSHPSCVEMTGSRDCHISRQSTAHVCYCQSPPRTRRAAGRCAVSLAPRPPRSPLHLSVTIYRGNLDADLFRCQAPPRRCICNENNLTS